MITTAQTIMLASIERAHGAVRRIAEDSDLGANLLVHCITDTRAYQCRGCHAVFTIEPDGECGVWARVD